jgi:hypothetical protein
MKNAILAVCCMAAVAAGHAFQRAYGGEMEDYGYSARQAADGGYIIVGKTQSYGAGGNDVWLVRTDERGDTLWTRTFGGPGYDEGRSVAQTPDGGYVIAGHTNSFGAGGFDVWLIRTDGYGDSVWTRTFGGAAGENGFSVQVTSDSGYVITGYTSSYGAGGFDVWLVRTDPNGDTMWTRAYGGPSFDVGTSIQQTADGGCIISGGTQSFGAGDFDIWLLKTDSMGDSVWTRTFGGSGSEYTGSVLQAEDGALVVAGYTDSYGAGEEDVWLLKIDSMGDTAWTRTFGSSARDFGKSVDVTADSGFVIVGYTGSTDHDCWLIKTDRDGGTTWTRTFGGLADDAGCSVVQTEDGGYVIGGYTMSYGAGWTDFWLIKTDTAGLLAVEKPANPGARRAAAATIVSRTLWYQPTANSSQPTAELLDIAGRVVMSLQPGPNDIRRVTPGIYSVRSADSGKRSEDCVRKIVIQH